MWTRVDLFKSLYFILKSSPTQFWVCEMLQVSIDLSVLYQVYHYSKRKYYVTLLNKHKFFSLVNVYVVFLFYKNLK